MADRDASSDTEEQGAWARPVSARYGEICMAVALLATAIFFVWQSALLPFGTVALPGPGFFPFALGIVLGLLGLAILWRSITSEEMEAVYLGHRDVLLVLAAMAGLAFAFERMDSYVAMGAFMAVLLLFVGHATPWKVAVGVILSMLAVWVFFQLGLGVRLPTGDFWDTLKQLMPFKPNRPVS
jgi:hypothetical protein